MDYNQLYNLGIVIGCYSQRNNLAETQKMNLLAGQRLISDSAKMSTLPQMGGVYNNRAKHIVYAELSEGTS